MRKINVNENMKSTGINIKQLDVKETMQRLYINKNLKRILIVVIILILSSNLIAMLNIKSQAVSIQIVPSTSRITNVTVSTSFQTCRDLDSLESTLGTTALDPHLSTNKDWGAVSYLANSIYGVNATYSSCSQGKVGQLVTIDSISFLSTTPNITGVMNWGGNPRVVTYSQTAGLLDSIVSKTDAQAVYDSLKNRANSGYSGKNIYNNIKLLVQSQYKDSRYVEKLVASIQRQGTAMAETIGWDVFGSTNSEIIYPICSRSGLFGYDFGTWYTTLSKFSTGGSYSNSTFRPVIWNIE